MQGLPLDNPYALLAAHAVSFGYQVSPSRKVLEVVCCFSSDSVAQAWGGGADGLWKIFFFFFSLLLWKFMPILFKK